MRTKQKLTFRWGLVLVMAAFLLTSCGAESDVVLPEVTPTQAEGSLSEETAPEAAATEETPEMEENAQAAEQTSSDGGEEVVESTPTPDLRIPEPVLGFEYGDPNLKATAPSSFVRAAGKPQLVELFAFW